MLRLGVYYPRTHMVKSLFFVHAVDLTKRLKTDRSYPKDRMDGKQKQR